MNKKFFILLPAFALLLAGCATNKQTSSSAAPTSSSQQATVAVESVSLNQTAVEVKIGESVTLIATIAPNNATNKKVTWASSAEAVATVVNGKVTAVASGDADITVTTEDGNKTATCHVTVPAPINYGTEENPLTPAQTYALIADLQHQEYTPQEVWCQGVVFESSWYASGSSINGWIQDGDKDQGVQLYGVKVADGLPDFSAKNALVGYTIKVHGYIEKFGETAEFTKKTVGEDTVFPEIKTAVAPSGDPTGVRLLSQDNSVDVGATLNLDARLVPLSAAGTITYESDHPEIASIAGNVLTGVAPGTAKVKAKSGELVSQEITITVNAAAYLAKVDFTKKSASNGTYTGSWDYAGWTLTNAANNNGGWAFIKLGKKNTEQECTIASPVVTSAATKVKVNFPSGSLAKTGMSVTSWGVKLYSDEAHESLTQTVNGNVADITNAAAEITLSGTFAANSYYVVFFNTADTSGSNGVVCVEAVTILA